MVARVRSALTLFGNLLRLAFAPLWLLRRALLRPRSRFVQVRLAAAPVELPMPTPMWQRWMRRGQPEGLASIDLLWSLVREIAADPAVDGLVVAIPHLSTGWATCTSARDPIAWLRGQGKSVVAYLPLGGGQRELYVASAAGRIIAPPSATLWLLGAAAQSMYLKPLLDRVGVSAEIFATGEYKTAAEALVRETMSDAQREQLAALADTIQRSLESALAERPGMDLERARACFEGGFFSGNAAVELGLLDACRYEDELGTELGELGDKPMRALLASRYLAYRSMRLWRPLGRKPLVGVVAVHGAIVDSAPRAPRLSGRPPASFEAVSRALRAARQDPRVRAVVLHIDSPGGSALASDLIHRELTRLREKKPVVACMGNVAASGGYYVAVACEKIVAQPTTTTGSIGVISARVLAADLLDHVGVRAHVVRSAPHADMFSPFRELTDDERSMLADHVRDFYQTFLKVVAKGRASTTDAIHTLARGRVWSGSDALGHGLVDVLGGLDKALSIAIELAPELAKLPRKELLVQWIDPPGSKPPIEAPADAVRAAYAEQTELLELVGDRGAALYYASVPKLGS
jgi:protease IV